MYVFRCLIEDDVPFTAGILRPIRVIAPEGSVVNALPPAAMAAGNVETSQRITDVLLGALAKAAPDRIPAASSGTMNNLSFGGGSAKNAFAYYETIAGGMGASAHADGASAIHTHMTNSWNTPIEAFEHQFPLRIAGYRVRRGSGGAGVHRGGDGIVREFEFLVPAEVTLLSDRRERGPWGLAGGASGKPGRNTLLRAGRSQKLPAKTRFEARPGDVLRIETPGGGGWGNVDGEACLALRCRAGHVRPALLRAERLRDLGAIFLRLGHHRLVVDGQHLPVPHDDAAVDHHVAHVRRFERIDQLRIDVVQRHGVGHVQPDADDVRALSGFQRSYLLRPSLTPARP